jgi:hypothetical protein
MSYIVMQVVVHPLGIDVPIQVDETIPQLYHLGHCLSIGWVHKACIPQDEKDVPAHRRSLQSTVDKKVAGNVGAALDGHLEVALHDILGFPVGPVLLQ